MYVFFFSSLRGLFGAGERAIYGWHGIDDFRLSERPASVALPAPRGKGWSLFTLDQRQRDPCPPRACQGVPYCKVTHPQVAVLDLPTPTRATSVTHALGLPTPAAPVASHTLSIVLPSVETEIVLLHRVIFCLFYQFTLIPDCPTGPLHETNIYTDQSQRRPD